MAAGARGIVANYLQLLFTYGAAGNDADGQLLGRFADDRDQRAFELLVARHGPMVLRVCRATLADAHDIEDAFQAVFLVLAKRAASVRSRNSVASWLFGVSSRVAARSRVDAARRRKHERLAAESRSLVMNTEAEEPKPLLIEEVDKLPGRYREAIVLCYLEGLSCDDAANRLGRPVGTIKSHLARGRKLLQQRLIRRGVAIPIGVTVAGVATKVIASVPPNLARNTVIYASRYIAGASLPASSALLLAEGVIKPMLSHKIGYVLLLGTGLAVVSLVVVKGLPAEKASKQAAVTVEQDQQVPEPPNPAVIALREALGNVNSDPYFMTFALIGLARAQNNAGDREAALTTFRLAAEVAEKVSSEHLRRLAIMRTAVARGKIGDAGPARITLERFAREARALSGQGRYDLMSMVIDFQFNAGFQDAARANVKAELAYVDAIADERVKDGGIYRLLYNSTVSRG
jgi:RNA polymerase sigma factor (sigma-70 family)